MLAWLRTGLTLTAVAVAFGSVVPGLRDGARTWPYAALGVGYAVLGVAIVLYGLYRAREVDRALREGRWIALETRAVWLGAAVAVALGAGTVVIIVADA